MPNSCSNRRHPAGPWHVATPLPGDWLDRLGQWLNRRAWGCGCYAADLPGEEFGSRRLLVATTRQGGGAPIVDGARAESSTGGTYQAVAVRRRQPGDSLWRLRTPNTDAEPARALVIGLSGGPGRLLQRMVARQWARKRRRGDQRPVGGCELVASFDGSLLPDRPRP